MVVTAIDQIRKCNQCHYYTNLVLVKVLSSEGDVAARVGKYIPAYMAQRLVCKLVVHTRVRWAGQFCRDESF